MKRMTLLEMVQSILSSLVSDNVNSIGDTEESIVVADFIKDTYYELLSREDWPFTKKLAQLEHFGDAAYPTFMKSPVDATYIRDIRYDVTRTSDTSKRIREIQYLPTDDFLDLLYKRNTSEDRTVVITEPTSGVPLFIYNNKAPEYYTTFDNTTIVFDSYDVQQDDALKNEKSIATVTVAPDWETADEFIPELPPQMFPTLLAESRVAAFTWLKQSSSPVDAKRGYRGGSMARHGSRRVKGDAPRKGFGRKA